MPKGPFLPSEFVPTKFSTAQDKADFGNTFLALHRIRVGTNRLFQELLQPPLDVLWQHSSL
jgi:hypothetical protein